MSPAPLDPQPPPSMTPAADLRRDMVDARIARRLFAVAAIGSILGSAVLWFTAAGSSDGSLAASVVWLALGLLGACLCALPDDPARRAITPFLSAVVTVLMVDAVLTGQGLLAPGMVAMPLLLLVVALLLPVAPALSLTVWACLGIVAIGFGVPLGLLAESSIAGLDITTRLYSLLACSLSAMFVGRFVAARFEEQARLSVRHEYRYRDLFDRVPSAVFLHDNGRVLDANRAALTLLGLSRRDELMGQDLRRFVPGMDNRARFEARLDQLATLSAGSTLSFSEFPMRRADHHTIHVRATATSLNDLAVVGGPDARQAPHSRRILSFIFDDSERHQAQAEAARARTLKNAIIDHSPYAVLLTDRADGRIVECNEACLRLVGRTRQEVLNRTSVELGLWPSTERRETYLQSIAQGAAAEQTLVVPRPNGQLRTVKINGSMLSIDGQMHVLVIGRDITDSRLREAVHEAVVDSAPVGLAITHGRRIISANPEIHRIFRMKPGSMIGLTTRQTWTDTHAHDERERQVEAEFAATGLTRFEQDFQLGDRRISVRMQGRVVSVPGDDLPTAVWIMEDITQEARAAQALRDAAAAAEQANRAKSLFLANMSHEVRTPLNGILGLLDMALDDDDAPLQRRHIELARENARVLADLVTDMLDLSKIEAGRLDIHEAVFDLRALMDSLEAVYRVIAEGRSLSLLFDLHALGEGAHWVRGDSLRVRQILGNYLSNALKFTEAGGVELRVRREGPTGPLRIEVQDSGPGIDLAVQARLFRAFEQGDTAPTRRQGGSGLGLAICRELAELMGGRVGVCSEPGQGSRFWVELPLATQGVPQGQAHGAAAEPDLAGIRILVVDDNPVNVLIADAMLRRAGARVTGVGDGQAALEAVAQAQSESDAYALILMDIQMPGLDGLEAARILRRTVPASLQVPIVALTAGALQSERDAALEAGMDDFITKPVDRDRLLACVDRWTSLPSPPQAKAA